MGGDQPLALLVAGPTASGKSALALGIAERAGVAKSVSYKIFGSQAELQLALMERAQQVTSDRVTNAIHAATEIDTMPGAVAAVREIDARLAAEASRDVLWVACAHGDVIKSIIADAVGSHLDNFQRITADPASMSVIRYTSARPFVLHVNHTGPALTAALLAKPEPSGDAVVGGSTD